ncbi:MAG: DUF5906 domain-containing protein [Devosia sp.]
MPNARTTTLSALAAHFGVATPANPAAGVASPAKPAANDNQRIDPPAADKAPSFALLADVMAALPNGDHYGYGEWVSFAHMLRGASQGTEFEAETRELWLDWSAQWGAQQGRALEVWESIHEPKTGWDLLRHTLFTTNPAAYDALNSRHARARFSHLNGSVADVLRPIPDWVEDLNGRYATVTPINGVLDLDPRAHGDVPFGVMGYTHFRTHHDNRSVDTGGKHKVGAGTAWLRHPQRRSYTNLGMWLPGQEPTGALNLFDGLPMPKGPAPAGASCSLILDFFLKVVSGGRDHVNEYVLNWFAWKLQHPLEKPGTNLILFGGQGTGKSTTGLFLLSMFGPRYSLHLTSDHQLLGNFNGHMEGKLVVLGDESLFGKNPALSGRYKALTTEDTMTIEHKGLTARQVANRMAFIFCSNSPTAVPVEGGDRRATVLRVEKRPGVDTAYFARLWAEWDNFGREAFMEFLLARDVTKFNPRVPLDTPEKLAMASSTADSFTLYWLERVQNPHRFGTDWDTKPTFIANPELEQDYREWCRAAQQRSASSAEIQERLDVLCPEAHRHRRTTQPRVYGRMFPPADRCRELAEQALSGTRPPDPSTA